MGKQINFFLTAADWAKIAVYLDKKGFVMFQDTSPSPSPVFLPVSGIGDPHVYKTHLCLKSQTDHVQWAFSKANDFYRVNFFRSPSISVLSGMDCPDTVFHGRFYYDPDFVDGDELCPKNQEFLEATRILFNWMRRNFPARKEAFGFYTSDAAMKKTLLWK